MSDSKWNPEQYHRFRNERQQPFFDLLALVRPAPAIRVVDLGCGTGELTAILHRQLQAAETLGLDRSETMLAKAGEHHQPGLRFERADIAVLKDGFGLQASDVRSSPEARSPKSEAKDRCELAESFDLVFSNAALQWVDDHDRLFRNLARMVKPGGQLAVQMPANHDHLSHVVAHAVASEEPFRSALAGYVRCVPVLAPETYSVLLDKLGFREQRVCLQVYPHHLDSRADVVEWVRGTLLVDYQERLSTRLFEMFLEAYRARLLPLLDDGRPYFYPFKRLLLWGAK